MQKIYRSFVAGLAWLGATSLYAQCPDNVRTATTKWDAPATSNTWNWTTAFYNDAYVKGKSNPYPIASPFYNPYTTFQNANIIFLQAPIVKDCQPEDGWELLTKDFGNGSSGEASAVTNPFFALYNRYTATIRAFFLVVDPLSGTNNGATVSLSFEGSTGRNESALLAHAYPLMNTLNNFQKGSVMRTPNRYSNEQDYWLVADFPVAYDPCTCLFASKIKFAIELIQSTSATLNIKLEGTSYLKQIIKKQSDGGVNVGDDNSSVLNLASGFVVSGTKGYKSFEGFKSAVEGVAGFLTAVNPGQKDDISKELTGWLNFGKAVPYLGGAVGILDFLIGGGRKTAKASAGLSAFEANLKHEIKGTVGGMLELTSPRGDRTIWTPGSNRTNTATAAATYDNVLGVFALLETPKIEYAEYDLPVSPPLFCYGSPNPYYDPNCYESYDDSGNPTCPPATIDYVVGLYENKIRQYHLASNIKYAINPAAKMDLVDLTVALVLEDSTMNDPRSTAIDPRFNSLNNRPASFGNYGIYNAEAEGELEAVMNTYGYEFETDTRFRTAFLPASCATNTSISVVLKSGVGVPFRYPKDVYLKVKAILRRKDADENTQDIIYVSTYKADITRSPADPGNLKFRKVQPTGNCAYYYAADNVLFPLPPQGIAGVKNPTYPTACATPLAAQTAQNIVTFCQNTSKYNPINNAARIGVDQGNAEKKKTAALLLQNTPNPFFLRTTIGYSVQSKGAVKLFVSDPYGRLVTTLVDNPAHEPGAFSVELARGGLRKGMYYYTLQTPEGKETKRMVLGE